MALQTLQGVLELDTSGFSKGTAQAEDDLDSLTDRAASTGSRLQSAGAAMTAGITAPLVAMGAMSARAAGNFDQSMQQSIAVMGEVNEAMREDLEATARDVATTTTVSATEAADAYYYLASAGLDASQAMEAMPRVAEFAEAGNMRMAEATDVATNVMSAFGYEASEMTEVTDTLTATVSNHNQTMQGMSTAMSQVAPVAASLGFSIEETSAAIGQMGDVGIQGERAGTALRNVLSQLSDEGSTVSKQLAQMGVRTRNSSGELLSLTQILGNMERAGVEAGDAASIFGTEAGPAMAALMKEGSAALQENTKRVREAEGATKQMAETQRDTLNAEMQIARSNIEDAGIAIGTVLMPMLSTVTGHVSTAAEWFGNLNETQQKAIVVAGGLAAALGPLALGVGTFLTMLPAMSTGWTMATASASAFAGSLTGGVVPAALATQVALGPITVPIWAIIAAVGALAAAFATDFMGIQGIVKGVADFVIKSLRTMAEGAIGALNKIPGVDIDVDDLPSADDITSRLPSASDLNPVGTAMGAGVSEGIREGAMSGEIPPRDLGFPDESTMTEEGQTAGASYLTGLRSGVSEGELITAKPTEEVKSALVDGVEGYRDFDNASEVEDAPTEINEALFDAMAENGGVSAEKLGVSDNEFGVLMDRYGGGGGSSPASGPSSGADIPSELLRGGSSSPSASGGLSKKLDKIAKKLDALVVEGDINVDDAEFGKFLSGVVRAEFGEEQDRYGRGVGQ